MYFVRVVVTMNHDEKYIHLSDIHSLTHSLTHSQHLRQPVAHVRQLQHALHDALLAVRPRELVAVPPRVHEDGGQGGD